MPQSLARRVGQALLAGTAVMGVLTILNEGRGVGLGWQLSDPVWRNALLFMSAAIGWFLADQLLIGLRSLRRRRV
jgi:hypothetical protein